MITWKRFLSVLLTVCLLLCCAPVTYAGADGIVQDSPDSQTQGVLDDSFNIFAPGFRLGLEYQNGLLNAPEAIEDSPLAEIVDYYQWDTSLIQSLAPEYNGAMKAYFDSITGIRAYTDLYSGGINLATTSLIDIQLPYSRYVYHLNTTGNGAANPWEVSLYIRTNGAVNTFLEDSAADKINRLVITATGYETYDVTFTHGTKKYPVAIEPVYDVIRDEDTGKLNKDMVFTFTPNAEFEGSINGVQLIWNDGSKEISSADYQVASGTLTVANEVFEDPAIPLYQSISVCVKAEGYADSSAAQLLQSSNPDAYLTDAPAMILRFPGRPEVTLSESDVYAFAEAHRYFYSVDGKIVYDNENNLGEKYYLNGNRYSKGSIIHHKDFLGLDIAQLFLEKMGVDFYELARNPNAPAYSVSMTATDGWGDGFQLSSYGYETAYFNDMYTTVSRAFPNPANLINLQYYNGTLLHNGLRYNGDSDRSTRFMVVSGKVSVIEVLASGTKAKAKTPVVAAVGSTPLEGTENIPATPSSVLTFSGIDTSTYGTTIFYSIAWGGEIPDDPVPSYKNVYMYRGKVTTEGATMFTARGGLATVKFITDGDVDSDVSMYSFFVEKANRGSPRGLSSPQPGEILGTTPEMEYNTVANATDGWLQAGEAATYVAAGGLYYVRYAENTNYYASPAATVTVAQPDKGLQAAPVGLSGVMPPAAGEKGAIDGTTAAMEYSSDKLTWLLAEDGQTGVLPGTYYVRYAGTESYLPSSAVIVTAPGYAKDYTGVLFEIIDRRDGKYDVYQVTPDLADLYTKEAGYNYSTVNTFGTAKKYPNYSGPELTDLFEHFALEMNGNDLIRLLSADNYSQTVLWDFLLEDRYYYPNQPVELISGQAPASAYVNPVKTPAIIALDYGYGTVMLGQRAPHEQTNDLFVQNMCAYNEDENKVGQIILMDGVNTKFPAITTASPLSGATVTSGDQVTLTWTALLGFSDGYIYYTTDGSEPTPSSQLYNYNTYNGANGTVYRPSIRAQDADPYSGNVTLKVKVFGKAKYPSDTVTYVYHVANYESVVPTVTFVYNDGATEDEVVEITAGAPVQEPKLPLRDNWLFQGWFLDGIPYDFTTPVTKDIILNARWAPDETDVLFVIEDERGDVARTYFVTEAIAQAAITDKVYNYSTVNTYGSPDKYLNLSNGVVLTTLFENLGINMEGSDVIGIAAADNYAKTVLWDYLAAERYYYPNLPVAFPGINGQAPPYAYENPVPVPAIIALDFDGGRLMLGQRAPHEQTNDVFAKNMTAHETYGRYGQLVISAGDSESFPAIVATEPAAGSAVSDGSAITLDWMDLLGFNDGYIYYTTDGSEPTFSSSLYNYNTYNNDQGDVFNPVIAAKDANRYTGEVTLKVKVFGKEKFPSETTSFTYQIAGYAGTAPQVTFVYNDGVTENAVEEVSLGDQVAQPVEPQKTDCQFMGWYNGSTLFDFTTPITEDLTLTAIWADGTEASPYLIADMNDLRWMAEMVNGATTRSLYRNKYYALTADISCDGAGFTPIGVGTIPANTAFSGQLDGRGHAISGLVIEGGSANYQGLFAYTYNARIRNLSLLDATVSGGSYVGGIAGYTSMTSLIENCYVAGFISGTGASVGGLVGSLNGQASGLAIIRNCYFNGDVLATNGTAGGLAGGSASGYARIENGYALGTVSGATNVGGIMGEMRTNVTLANCLAFNQEVMATTATTGQAGRIAGNQNNGTVAECYAWAGLTVNAALTNVSGSGTGVSTEAINATEGWPTGFKAAPWAYEAGYLPILAGFSQQNSQLPGYLRLAAPSIKGDVNNDGVIDFDDVLDALNHYLGTALLESDAFQAADVNMDGAVDFDDVLDILNHYLGVKMLEN